MNLMHRSANMNKLSNKWCREKKKVPVSFPPAQNFHSFPGDWLRDLRQSLLIMKGFWQRPLLPLVLFFIHGHELLVAERRGRRAKAMRPTASLALKSWGRRNNKDKRLERVRGLTLDLDDYAVCVAYTAFTLPCCWYIQEWLILWLSSHLSLLPNPECVTLFHPQDKIIHSGEFIQSSEFPPAPFSHLLYSYLFLTETHECAGSPVRLETTDHSYANPPQPTHEMWTRREQLPIMLLPSVHLLVWNTQLEFVH